MILGILKKKVNEKRKITNFSFSKAVHFGAYLRLFKPNRLRQPIPNSDLTEVRQNTATHGFRDK